MMTINKWAKRLTLRQFAHPVAPVRTGKRLSQPEDAQEKPKHGDCPDQQPEALRRVGKNEHSSKINRKCRDLYESESCGIRIKRETADQGNGMGDDVLRMSQRQKLEHAQQKHSKQGQLQNIPANP